METARQLVWRVWHPRVDCRDVADGDNVDFVDSAADVIQVSSDDNSSDDGDEPDEDSERLDELKNTYISKVILADELRDAMEAADALRAEEDEVVEKARNLEDAIRQQQYQRLSGKTDCRWQYKKG